MPKERLRLTGEALKFFQKVGSKGGKNRARKHSKKTLKNWASRGGRPARPLEIRIAAKTSKFEKVQAAIRERFLASEQKFNAAQINRQAKHKARMAFYEERFNRTEAKRATHERNVEAPKVFKAEHKVREEKFKQKQQYREEKFQRTYKSLANRFERRLANFNAAQAAREKHLQLRIAALSEAA